MKSRAKKDNRNVYYDYIKFTTYIWQKAVQMIKIFKSKIRELTINNKAITVKRLLKFINFSLEYF